MAAKVNNAVSREPDYITIDLLDLAKVIWQKIWIVLIGLVVGIVLAFTVTKVLMTPQYQATSVIYLFSKTTSITSLADLQVGSQLTADFQIIATTRDVVEDVIETLNLDSSYEQLVSQISVTNPTSSHMLQVTVTDPNAERAAKICNALSDKLRDQIADIINTDKPSMVQRAVVPTRPSSPNLKKNVGIGALLGVVLAAAFIVLRYVLDDTIKTREDVEKYLGVDVLAAFPVVKDYNKSVQSNRFKANEDRRMRERSR
jgi:capsular polysaccharide biosynthesis protein